ncbi:hypothetical protein PBS_33180 [Paraburkholderia sp. 2C]
MCLIGVAVAIESCTLVVEVVAGGGGVLPDADEELPEESDPPQPLSSRVAPTIAPANTLRII